MGAYWQSQQHGSLSQSASAPAGMGACLSQRKQWHGGLPERQQRHRGLAEPTACMGGCLESAAAAARGAVRITGMGVSLSQEKEAARMAVRVSRSSGMGPCLSQQQPLHRSLSRVAPHACRRACFVRLHTSQWQQRHGSMSESAAACMGGCQSRRQQQLRLCPAIQQRTTKFPQLCSNIHASMLALIAMRTTFAHLDRFQYCSLRARAAIVPCRCSAWPLHLNQRNPCCMQNSTIEDIIIIIGLLFKLSILRREKRRYTKTNRLTKVN